jgi:hypothetical protein
MDRKTKTLRERVLEHVAVLRIPLTADELDAVLSTTERESLSLLESLDRLLGEQAARRRDRGISRRIPPPTSPNTRRSTPSTGPSTRRSPARSTNSSPRATSSGGTSMSSWSGNPAWARAI